MGLLLYKRHDWYVFNSWFVECYQALYVYIYFGDIRIMHSFKKKGCNFWIGFVHSVNLSSSLEKDVRSILLIIVYYTIIYVWGMRYEVEVYIANSFFNLSWINKTKMWLFVQLSKSSSGILWIFYFTSPYLKRINPR